MMKTTISILVALMVGLKCFANCPSSIEIQERQYLAEGWKIALPSIGKKDKRYVYDIERPAHQAPHFTHVSINPRRTLCFYKSNRGMVFYLIKPQAAHVLRGPNSYWYETKLVSSEDPQFWGCVAEHGAPEDCPFEFT